MACNKIVEKYLTGLKNVLSVEPTDSGCILYFPFLDPSNDPIMILVEQMGDKFRVSDLAQANEYLFLHGLDIKPETKAEYYYNDVVKRFGINSKDDELFVEVEEKNITEAINKILTAVNSIDHIIYTQSMAGFLSEKKPNWTKEQIEAAKSSARKEMAKIISEILDREWMCDLNEIKYILDCVANGNSDPFKDRPEKGDDPK